jgi:hypothetical protein
MWAWEGLRNKVVAARCLNGMADYVEFFGACSFVLGILALLSPESALAHLALAVIALSMCFTIPSYGVA